MAKKKHINFLLYVFIIIPVVTLLIALVKLAFPTTTEVYVNVKVSQGLWWATTSRPNYWFAKSIHKGDKQFSLTGKTMAEIMEVRYYPYMAEPGDLLSEDKYNIYMIIKLNASGSQNSAYKFNRNKLIAGAPIEIETPNTQITGTVLSVSDKPLERNYVEKHVTLYRKEGYDLGLTSPYDGITVGSKYFDGTQNVVEILKKYYTNSFINLGDDKGNLYVKESSVIRNIFVEAKMMLREENGSYYFGEDKEIKKGGIVYLPTNDYVFGGYTVAEIK